MQSFWCVYKWRVNPNTYACICRQYETQCMRVMKTHTQTHIKYIQTYEWWHISMQFAAARPQSHSDVSISPFELFKPLQFRLISKIYEFGSQQITHPLISPLSLSQHGVGGVGRGGGGGVFLPSWAWISTVAGGRGCQPIRRCCYHWLSGSRPWILSAARQPFFPKCPPDNEGEEKKKENQDVYWSDWSESEKHKFYGLNKSNPIWPGWHFTVRHRKGQTEIGGCYQTHRGNSTEAVQGDSTFEFQWTQTHTDAHTHFALWIYAELAKEEERICQGPKDNVMDLHQHIKWLDANIFKASPDFTLINLLYTCTTTTATPKRK